jgi:hypothetical protein
LSVSDVSTRAGARPIGRSGHALETGGVKESGPAGVESVRYRLVLWANSDGMFEMVATRPVPYIGVAEWEQLRRSNFRRRVWLPALAQEACPKSISTICATPATR